MDAKNTMSISEARKRIFEIAEEVQKPDKYYTLTEKGKPKAVLMSAKDFDSWQETLEVMRDFPNLDNDIKKTNEAIKSGEYKSWTTLEELLAKEGFVVAEKTSKKYGISAKNQTRRRKSAK
jgi:prevent-host-death family protein